MIDYRVEIEFVSSNDSYIGSFINYDNEFNIQEIAMPNNISPKYEKREIGDFTLLGLEYEKSKLNTISKGDNVFILGSSKLGDGSKFADSYNGFMTYNKSSSELSSYNDYTVSENCRFIISGADIKNIIVNFDSITNEYATRLNINGKIIENDKNQLFYILDDNYNNIEIIILGWNKPNRYVKLTSITINISISYNQYTGLLNFTRGSQSMQDNILPNFGYTIQYATVNLIDKNNEIYEYESMGILNNNINAKLYIDDMLAGEYILDNYNKETNSNRYNLTFTDLLNRIDKINPNERISISGTANDFYEELVKITKSYIKELVFDSPLLDLSDIKIEYISYIVSSLSEAWIDFCEMTESNLYIQPNGKAILRRYEY